MKDLKEKVAVAGKWSVLAEIISKLIAPITSIVLARVLTPEAFGVIATINMLISFVEIFTDAGFQRYIIQHEFVDDKDKYCFANVAFWANFIMSLIIWGIISFFSEHIAVLVGNPGLGNVLTIACISIPISAFCSIQMALLKRSLDFKTLFFRRLIGVLIPLFITVPLAFILRSYWALVLGTIAVNIANVIVLSIKSSWHPSFYFDFARLRKMISFSLWSVIDAIMIWATSYLEIFFIGVSLSAYYIGLYKTAMSTVSQFTNVITAAILPILMPAFSRVQNDHSEMRNLLLSLQKYMSVFLLPLGFGILIFRKLVVEVMLGEQWWEIIDFVGLWGIMEVITVVFSRFCSNIYPAIGKPRISVLVQLLHLLVLIPAVLFSIDYGFEALYWTRTLVRIELIIVNMFFAYMCIRISPWKMISNILPEFFSCTIMALVALFLLQYNDNTLYSFLWIVVSVLVYIFILCFFREDRELLLKIKNKFIKKSSSI